MVVSSVSEVIVGFAFDLMMGVVVFRFIILLKEKCILRHTQYFCLLIYTVTRRHKLVIFTMSLRKMLVAVFFFIQVIEIY